MRVSQARAMAMVGLITLIGPFRVRAGSGQGVEPARGELELEEFGSDSTAYDVVSVLVSGPTEAVLWDAQYHVADARRVADRIAAKGVRLKAIILSHPDHDHYAGAAAIVERFPGTPVYMTAAALREFERTARRGFDVEKARQPSVMADSLVTPVELPSMRMTVDGAAIEVIPDLTGDVLAPTNSILWIPSLRAVLAGDVVFQDIHPWLAVSTVETRRAWRGSLKRIADLKPVMVVAGHKKDVNAPDTPDNVRRMEAYLDDFDGYVKSAAGVDEFVSGMLAKYPDHTVAVLLRYSASRALQSARAGG